ncbi:hypothetical protein THIOM_004485 [Candidatus Thiomargarita nelsonii]|uniref:Uncharacterized protein n=1 Tax=Candidatus Thiomargarita nelsonii TaxID=1003181 RepID=A0A176RVW1_9GAMM|nr:hypothetical protein THIOM_004485 [Candidatus Thiomargarita nelsonii]
MISRIDIRHFCRTGSVSTTVSFFVTNFHLSKRLGLRKNWGSPLTVITNSIANNQDFFNMLTHLECH